jgi:hypothetical protein
LLIASDHPKGEKCNQDYFAPNILLGLEREKETYKRKERGTTWEVDMDRSKSHDSGKIQASTLFSSAESMWRLALWNDQGKNEGSVISHSSRYSRPFDGDLEWPHFGRRPTCSLSGRPA